MSSVGAAVALSAIGAAAVTGISYVVAGVNEWGPGEWVLIIGAISSGIVAVVKSFHTDKVATRAETKADANVAAIANLSRNVNDVALNTPSPNQQGSQQPTAWYPPPAGTGTLPSSPSQLP